MELGECRNRKSSPRICTNDSHTPIPPHSHTRTALPAKLYTCCFLSLLLLVTLQPAFSDVTAERQGTNIILRNDLVRAVISLPTGGRIAEYTYQPFGKGNITEISAGGLLMDHVWEQQWPGEFWSRVYAGEVVSAGPREATVRVWTTGEGSTIKGLKFERWMTLRDGERALHCTVSISNPTADGRVTGYWNQNVFWFQQQRDGQLWSQPTTRGISHDGWFVDDFTSGWIGASNAKLAQGIVFVMDYNDLFRLYPNSMDLTTEWMYDKVAIPPGKTWTTRFAVIPVSGMERFSHGSANMIANLTVTPMPGSLQITHQLTRGLVPLKNVTVKTTLKGLRQPWSATIPEATFPALTDAVQTASVRATGVEGMPAVITVTVTGTAADGAPVSESYQDYVGGDYGANIDLRTGNPLLSLPRPAKAKVYLKPDVLRYTPNPKPRILFLRGMYSKFFRVDQALKARFPNAEITDGWLDSSSVGLLLSYFPADYPGLLSYDLVVLANMPAAPLDLIGQEMLADYLQAGGNVLLLGGDRAYGQGDFVNTNFLAAMPVEFGGHYNWRKLPAGALKITAAHPVTAGVTFGAKDMVYYSHLCRPKPGAIVAAGAGDRPLLVLGSTPKGGRVACVLATPFGEAAPGETAFWDAPAWQELMGNTVNWLVKR